MKCARLLPFALMALLTLPALAQRGPGGGGFGPSGPSSGGGFGPGGPSGGGRGGFSPGSYSPGGPSGGSRGPSIYQTKNGSTVTDFGNGMRQVRTRNGDTATVTDQGAAGVRVRLQDGTSGTVTDQGHGTRQVRLDNGTSGTVTDYGAGMKQIRMQDGTTGTVMDQGNGMTQIRMQDGTRGTLIDQGNGARNVRLDDGRVVPIEKVPDGSIDSGPSYPGGSSRSSSRGYRPPTSSNPNIDQGSGYPTKSGTVGRYRPTKSYSSGVHSSAPQANQSKKIRLANGSEGELVEVAPGQTVLRMKDGTESPVKIGNGIMRVEHADGRVENLNQSSYNPGVFTPTSSPATTRYTPPRSTSSSRKYR